MIHVHALPAALLTAVVLAGPTPAGAQALIDATDPDGIVEIAKGYGEAVLEADNTGDPMISGKIDQTNYVVFFYGCTDNADCSTIQFMSSYTNIDGVDLDLVNSWNAEQRFGKAYLDSDRDPVIEMNVNLWSGVSPDNLNDTFDWWRLILETFEDYIGFVPADGAATTDTPVTRDAQTDTPPAATGNPTASGIGTGTLGGGSKVKVNR